MTDKLKIVLAQINPVVGDIEGNLRRVMEARRQAEGADLLVCPELVMSGYPPEDLALRPSYVEACRQATLRLAGCCEKEAGPAVIVGSPWPDDTAPSPRPFNAAVLIESDGTITGLARKVCLPNYGPFDEPRTFKQGPAPRAIPFRGIRLGLMICEDMWMPGVAGDLRRDGADVLVVPHGSPFRRTVHAERIFQAEARARETGLPVLFVNQCGGQDELVFDGGCFALDTDGIKACCPLFEETAAEVTLEKAAGGWTLPGDATCPWPEDERLIYEALLTGTRDYVRKSGFNDVVIGLSGGIDSALVAAIAVDAFGPEHVHCVRLPSRYTSEGSMTDAAACADRLGTRLDTVGIEPAVEALTGMLSGIFEGRGPDITEENLQSRIRGTALMAVSNKLGSMMLTTGNKSEMAVGYATLYGDMNGGYNPLKDVYKTDVFRLARWRNAHTPSFALGPQGEVIPETVITKPPSAELRENQEDTDSLPPYDVLDDILHGLIEEEISAPAIVARGRDEGAVNRVQALLYRAEYKRRQSAPGPKITSKYFGRDRRYPIVNHYKS